MTPVERCSFCLKSRKEVRAMVRGKHARICDVCLALAQSPFATVARCSGCRVMNGKHEKDCSET